MQRENVDEHRYGCSWARLSFTVNSVLLFEILKALIMVIKSSDVVFQLALEFELPEFSVSGTSTNYHRF